MPDLSAHAATATDDPRSRGKAPSGRRRGRRRGVEVRPGSVKQARLEAGLSLGQVALGDISRTAIYFVETGKAKPSMETLQLIASRTNKPIEYFLDDAAAVNDDAALIVLERLVATGDNVGAGVAGEALVARTPAPRIGAHANLLMAMAYIRLGQAVRARSCAAAARAHFEQAGDVAMSAEALSWEAAGALVVQDPAALGLAQEALSRCRSLKPVPTGTEAKVLYILGTVHSSRHEYAKAIDAYEQASAAGSAFTDLRQLSYVYGNLSLAYEETGQYAQAAHYAHRAMALHETLQDRISIARVLNNLAVLLMRQGDYAGAGRHANESLKLMDELGVEAGKAHVLMTLCELALARSDLASARAHADAALEVAERMGEGANAGEVHTWLARIAAAQGDHLTCDDEFAIAFVKFDALDAAEWSARARARYAEILEARGDLTGANRQLRLALAAVGTGVGAAAESVRIAIA